MNPSLLSLTLLLALHPARGQDWTPSPEQAAVYRALSVRGAGPACVEVEALAADPLPALLTVVERATMPPWAPMRAAHCVASRHAEAAREALLSWVGQEQTRGLGLLVLDELDGMPTPLALELAQAALGGPIAVDARARLAGSTVPELRALVSQAPGQETNVR